MLRVSLGVAAVLTMCTAFLLAADQPSKDNKNAQANEPTKDNKNAQANKQEKATITKVDAKNGTVTVKMKDKNGKTEERTFKLTEDVRYFDSTGRAAALDVFRSGNEVLVVEEQGKIKEMHKNKKHSNTEPKDSSEKNKPEGQK